MLNTISSIIQNASKSLSKEDRIRSSILIIGEYQPKYAERAVKRYAVGAFADEVLLIYSSAPFRFGSSGITLTSRAIYRSKDLFDSPRSLDYADIYTAGFYGRDLYINEEPFALKLPHEPAARLIAEILAGIQISMARDTEGTRLRYRLETLEVMRAKKLIRETEYSKARAEVIAKLGKC